MTEIVYFRLKFVILTKVDVFSKISIWSKKGYFNQKMDIFDLKEDISGQNGLFLTNCKVRKNYNYKIVAAKDLEGHAELKTSVVKQRMSINFTAPADLLKFYLEQLSFDVVEFGEPLRKCFLIAYFKE